MIGGVPDTFYTGWRCSFDRSTAVSADAASFLPKERLKGRLCRGCDAIQ